MSGDTITLELTAEELKAIRFAVDGDLETVADNMGDWPLGEVLDLQLLSNKLKALSK